MNELALFAGAGGGILGGLLHGWRTVAAVEIEEYPRAVLLQRQADGCLPKFPIWDDVRTFDGNPWRGLVDIITGGFPCQDISCAGKGAGLDGERSGLWSEMARIIGEVRPPYALMENSPMLTGRGLDKVLMGLAEMGYDAEWGVLGAVNAGAPHKRERIWILATNTNSSMCDRRAVVPGWGPEFGTSSVGICKNVPDTDKTGLEGQRNNKSNDSQRREIQNGHPWKSNSEWWKFEPNVGRVANGVAARVDRLKAIGNGQVPAVAALAWGILSNRIDL